jgi:hypothetical protein
MKKFEEMCEKFGVIKQTRTMMYPRQIVLSDAFISALKTEYYRMTLEEDTENPIKDKPLKFIKALQFHVKELEENKEAELEAYRKMMDNVEESADYKTKKEREEAKKKIELDDYRRRKKYPRADAGLKKSIVTTKENTEEYVVTTKGKPVGNTTVNKKAEDQRRKEIKKENIVKESFSDLAIEFKNWATENFGDVILTKEILNQFKRAKGLAWDDVNAKKLYTFVVKQMKPSQIVITQKKYGYRMTPRYRKYDSDSNSKDWEGDYDDVQPGEDPDATFNRRSAHANRYKYRNGRY